jgi:hypothetical protein
MADSVALLRRKVEDPSLAVQDGTMNSVITLAAIEVNPLTSTPPSRRALLTGGTVRQGEYASKPDARRWREEARGYARWYQRCTAD